MTTAAARSKLASQGTQSRCGTCLLLAPLCSLLTRSARSCVPNLGAKPKGDKRLHLGDEVEALRDHAALSVRRPVDRGFVVNTPLQRDIWDRIFSRVLKARAVNQP